MSWTWEEFLALPRTEVRCDIHCVTQWSRLDNRFEGVPIREIIAARATQTRGEGRADPRRSRLHDQSDARGAGRRRRGPRALARRPGSHARITAARCACVVPKLYFWKSAKWLRGFEFLDVNPPGFWEVNGYHMHGDPWRRRALLRPGDARDAADAR